MINKKVVLKVNYDETGRKYEEIVAETLKNMNVSKSYEKRLNNNIKLTKD